MECGMDFTNTIQSHKLQYCNTFNSFSWGHIAYFFKVGDCMTHHESLPEGQKIEVCQNKYLKEIIEQDHRFTKNDKEWPLVFANCSDMYNIIRSLEHQTLNRAVDSNI